MGREFPEKKIEEITVKRRLFLSLRAKDSQCRIISQSIENNILHHIELK